MEYNSLPHLPKSILLNITYYLNHSDLLNFRITCSAFYQTCSCSDVLRRFHIRPRYIIPKFVEFMEKLNGGRHIKLSLQSLAVQSFCKIFPTLSHVTDICVKIQDLNNIVKSCKHIHRLKLIDNVLDQCSSHNEDLHQEYFKCLSDLEWLNEIILKGRNQVYSAAALAVVIKNAAHVKKFGIDSLTVNNGKKPSLLVKVISASSNIKHWSFNDVVFINKKGIMLPMNTLSFECINTVISPLDGTHTELNKICIHGIIPYFAKYWRHNNFRNLHYLELQKAFFYQTKLPVCSRLCTLKLLDCHNSLNYLLNLSPAVERSLRKLVIQAYKNYNNEGIIALLGKFKNLEHLHLIDMNQISCAFLCEVKHEKLKRITIRNCMKFYSTQTKCQLNDMKKNLTFQVELLECQRSVCFV